MRSTLDRTLSKRPQVESSRHPMTWKRVLLYVFLISTSLVMAYPLLFMLVAGFTSLTDYQQSTWFPAMSEIYMDNWGEFLGRDELPLWIFNTLVRAVWYILMPATIAVLGGYVFARLRFRGRDTLFLIILASMMVPPIVYMVPLFIGFARIPTLLTGVEGNGLIDTWWALLLPGWVSAFYIFLMRQTYQSIPGDYEEAARVDGASTAQIIWQIYLPLLRPALIVLVIFQFVIVWNDYLNPLVFAGGNQEIQPIALAAERFIFKSQQIYGRVDYPRMFAVATIVTLPILILFLALQRYFVEGVAGFGIKG